MEDRYLFILFTSGTISLQCDANGIQQILIAEWLGEKFDGSSFHSADTHGNVAMAGDKDYRNTGVSGCELALKIESTQSRKSDVKHKTTGRIWHFFMQEGVGRIKTFNL
jgi:hypothetical protein